MRLTRGLAALIEAAAVALLMLRAPLVRRIERAEGRPSCRACGCTDGACCVDAGGQPCWWVEEDLCSACDDAALALSVSADPAAGARASR